MADAVIGALRVDIGANTARFEESLKGANKELNIFANNVLKIGAKVAGGLVAAAGVKELVQSFKQAIDEADKLGKTAQKIGVPVEELSALKLAADLADVSMEELSTSMGKLAKNMSAVAGGAKGPAADAFKAMGIEVKNADGELKTSSQVLSEVADKFQQYEDSASKTALAIAIFGRSGANLIPLLNEGSAGIAKATEEARKFGIVITNETAKAAQDFNDNLTRLSYVFKGLFITLMADSVEPLSAFSESMIQAAKNLNVANSSTNLLSGTVKTTGIAIVWISGKIAQWALDLQLVIEATNALRKGDISGVREAYARISEQSNKLKEENTKVLNSLLGIQETVKPLVNDWKDYFETVKAVHGVSVQVSAPIIATKNAMDTFLESTKKSIGVNEAAAATVGKTAGAQAKLKFETEALRIAHELGEKEAARYKEQIAQTGVEVEKAANKQQRAQQIQQLKEYVNNLNRSNEAQQLEISTINQSAGARERAKINLQALHFAQQNNIPVTAAWKAQVDAAALSAGDLADKLEGIKLTQEFMTPWQLYGLELAKINDLLAKQKISTEVAEQASIRAAANMANAYGAAAQGIVSPMADAFKSLASINKRYAGAAKAAAIAEATINTFVAATKALAQGGALGFATAAAVTAAGLANVAKIASTEFATGGSFRVAGGMTGIDSELVAFKATPGEMVDIRRPGSDRSPSSVQTIELRFPRPNDFFSQYARQMVDALNAASPDGYVIKVAT